MFNRKSVFIVFYALALVLCFSGFAYAGPIENAVDWVVQLLTSGIARGVAIIGIAVLGYMAWAGKLTWEKGLMFMGGIVLVFGGATIVDAFIGVAK